MTPLLIITAIAAAPVLLAIFLGVNSVLLFLSVAVGIILQSTLTDSAGLALAAFTQQTTNTPASIGLIVAPVLLTLIFLRRSAKAGAVVLQLIPLVLTGAMFGYVMLGVIGDPLRSQVYDSQFGVTIKQASDVVIATAAGVNLLLAWRLYRVKLDAKHGKHHG